MPIDISRPASDFLPQAGPGKRGGFWKSVGLLLAALAVATLVGAAAYWLLELLVPTIPVYSGLIVGIIALVFVLQVIARRFEWIMPWYYLLPALLFLITFTLFPVVLTIMLAFSDYAGTRNGELNVASETPIVSAAGNEITLQNLTGLHCDELRNGCRNVRALVYASGEVAASATQLEHGVLSLSEPLPEGRQVKSVEITVSMEGFPIPVRVEVASTNGQDLTLLNAPPILTNAKPGDVQLDDLRLLLDREALERTILAVNGSTLTLNAPLPDGLNFQSIARYNDFGWVGLRNFRQILRNANRALLPVFTWNVAFAFLTVLINTACGVFMAVLLNNPQLRFRGLYRTLLIVPWALPSVITIQVWKGFLNTNFGAINRILALLDLPVLDWLGNPWAARSAILLVNLWLGLPFIMTATLGALSAIPDDLYEAAKIDGASAWQRFWWVTSPLLRTALIPITLTGFAFNFNNFNVIYLLTDGGPAVQGGTATARATDILISWAYNEAFRSQGQSAYGFGSAISVLIFIITIAISLINFRVTGALKEEASA